ncbi:DUF3846 domain-containing protein [Candidatus Enterococcus courvalinii]|uniref:DUF3846 domain-containing protein n=1 Tax=Candidatus Enterococcus courvalinii TaxID=2815329 RepID=A0ABS3HYP5_9ENTE|nr:DUF3846 domain-containing protein [Enterococcus sp. MSG2901]MBO0481540.1 DUF3846 domain-containing protein [Enterococcus sp. MSG2901]
MTGRNYVVIFESNNENQIVAKVQSVKESPISLKTLHELTGTDIVERIVVNETISIYCDEEAKLKSNNYISDIMIEDKEISIVGKFCFVGETTTKDGSRDTVPLTDEQVAWITQNIKYRKEARTLA